MHYSSQSTIAIESAWGTVSFCLDYLHSPTSLCKKKYRSGFFHSNNLIADNVLLDNELVQLLKALNITKYFELGELYSLGIHMQVTELKLLIPRSVQTVEAVCLRLTFNLPN